VEGFRTWSVGLDDGVVTALLPEPLRFPSGPLPEWMGRCATAIRDALRELPIADGTVLEATLAGVPPEGADLGDALLYNVRIPEAQVYSGVRLRRAPAEGPAVIQTYRRAPIAVPVDEGDETEEEPPLATVQVPLKGVFELDTARLVWLAVRRVAVATLPAASPASGGIELRVRLVAESEREPITTELLERLFDGIRASFQVYEGDVDGASRRLASELKADPSEMTKLLTSPNGALLPAGERFAASEVIVTTGANPKLAIELRPATE
jgi:hypothetical protein